MEPAGNSSASLRPTEGSRPSGWFILLRLVMFCLVAGAFLYLRPWGTGGHSLLWVYFATTLAFLLFYRRWQESTWRLLARWAGGLLLLLEIAMEGVLVAQANAFTSPVVLLFLLTIVGASLQFRLVGTLLVATACSATVAFAIFVGVVGPDPLPQAARDFALVLELNDDLFYAMFVYICAFYLAAFVSGYLSERLELKDLALEGASRALAQARLETDDILRHMQSGLLTINASGTLVYFNKTAVDILGYAEHEVTGRHCREVFSERMPAFADLLLSALHGDRAGNRTELRLQRQGNFVPIGISTSLLGNAAFGVRGVIAIFQDLTEAKKLEERIRVADRLAAVGELSASIAHEIRNPLATVTGSVEMLRQSLPGDDDNGKLLELILKESSRLNKIVGDFLDFARIKQQACQAVDLYATAREVAALFEHHPARGAGSEIALEFPEGPLLAAAAEEQVKQILVNLTQNALEALPAGTGQVHIAGRILTDASPRHAGRVELSVIDNGTGIPAEVRDKIGQPFFSTKKQGTGLGLAIVGRLAVACGGSLHWTTAGERGTRFVVLLPAYSQDHYLQEVSGLAAGAEV